MSSSRCTSPSARSTSTATATLAYGGAPVPKRMNRITSAGRKAKGFLWPVQEPDEVQDRSDTERAIESGLDTDERREQLAGRPKDPEL